MTLAMRLAHVISAIVVVAFFALPIIAGWNAWAASAGDAFIPRILVAMAVGLVVWVVESAVIRVGLALAYLIWPSLRGAS